MTKFRVLGPIGIWSRGRPVDVGQPRQRAILAALLVDAGRLVPLSALMDRVWGEEPPQTARRSLHAHISRIRQVLQGAAEAGQPPARIVFASGGYLLKTEAGEVDLHRFHRLVERARDPDREPEVRAALLDEALALWHGEPLAGMAGDWAERTRESLRQQYLTAAVAWARAERQLGNHEKMLEPLAGLAADHPYAEAVEAELMRALHALGRTAEAAGRYAGIRQRLVDDLGLEPGAELQSLHQSLLRGEPETPAVPSPAPVPVPRQLPADVAGFTGRAGQLARLGTLLDGRAGPAPAAVVISAVSGTAGVGKTALAVHWAHQVAGRFPDGQLYVNLRGFDPGGRAMDPADAVRGFLAALEVPPQRVPGDPDAQAALYRSLLSGRRMLIVLDNARDTAQVRPLLPGASGSLVLVTSRSELTSLIAAHGAVPLLVDVLSAEEARQLLARRIGAERVAAEPEAVARIIAACARLPLALALVAARAAIQPRRALRGLADELADPQRRWQTLAGDDASTDVRAVFSWSYHALSPGAARLFRLLGLAPGPDIGAPAAASLAGLAPAAIRAPLAELTGASLLSEHVPGRYALHDLLRAYASELARQHEEPGACAEASRRLLDHYLHTAQACVRILYPVQDLGQPLPAGPGVTPEIIAGHAHARSWLAAELPVLLAALRQAGTGLARHVVALSWALVNFLDRASRWDAMAKAQPLAIAAAQHLGDLAGQANARRALARAQTRQGREDDAEQQLTHALALFEQAGDLPGQARTLLDLSFLVEERGGDPARSLEYDKRALDVFTAAGDVGGRANALHSVAVDLVRLGTSDGAVEMCQEALKIFEDHDDTTGQASCWSALGMAHQALAGHERAVTCFKRAVEFYRAVGGYFEASALLDLGDAQVRVGAAADARGSYRRALSLLRELDHPRAESALARLSALESPSFRRTCGGKADPLDAR